MLIPSHPGEPGKPFEQNRVRVIDPPAQVAEQWDHGPQENQLLASIIPSVVNKLLCYVENRLICLKRH